MDPKVRLRILLEAKPNSWIALSDDETALVATGDTYEEALNAATRNGAADPVLLKTPEEWVPQVL